MNLTRIYRLLMHIPNHVVTCDEQDDELQKNIFFNFNQN